MWFHSQLRRAADEGLKTSPGWVIGQHLVELRVGTAGGHSRQVVGQSWTSDWQLGEEIWRNGVPGSALRRDWPGVSPPGQTAAGAQHSCVSITSTLAHKRSGTGATSVPGHVLALIYSGQHRGGIISTIEI